MTEKNIDQYQTIKFSSELVHELIRECKIMRSRVEAILGCDDAINFLVAEDVFGSGFAELLIDDKTSLQRIVADGERELGTTVEV